jgi:hypothetical protein
MSMCRHLNYEDSGLHCGEDLYYGLLGYDTV